MLTEFTGFYFNDALPMRDWKMELVVTGIMVSVNIIIPVNMHTLSYVDFKTNVALV